MRLVIGVLMVVGCGKNQACLDYTDSYGGCIEAAEGAGLAVDVDLSDPDGFCDETDFTDEKWNCLTAAYGGDCGTEEGLAAILVVAEGC